jgi:hypothetical protein
VPRYGFGIEVVFSLTVSDELKKIGHFSEFVLDGKRAACGEYLVVAIVDTDQDAFEVFVLILKLLKLVVFCM